MTQRVKILIKGVVQGVGFRPYVYASARRLKLHGFVANNTQGVAIEVEGKSQSIENFLRSLSLDPPSVSRITTITKTVLPLKGYTSFIIKQSTKGKEKNASAPHDLATCKKCVKELFNPRNRRFHYPFINCTQCGPRYTIIKTTPYDRASTTMERFTMCPLCRKEYELSSNRRFHAQPNACFSCGPAIALEKKIPTRPNKNISEKKSQAIIQKTVEHIYSGKIIAVKSLGGYHICANAKDISAIERLRKRKQRPTKPFAIMVCAIGNIEQWCYVNSKEKQFLESSRRPIVLLRIKKREPWMEEIAPGQEYLGIILAYTPLHYLLFENAMRYDKNPIFVMTSANKKDFPLVYTEAGLTDIKDHVDYYLVHNRPIHTRCDDSIVRILASKEIVIRKARGYTSEVFPLATKESILGTGAELKHTFSIASRGALINSAYIGDLKHYKNFEYFQKLYTHYKCLYNFSPRIVAYDMHPGYLSTQFALSLKNLRPIPIQHHHAHIASCLLEHNLFDKVIGVCFDGTGFGDDRTIWGGEFLIADRKHYQRVAHFAHLGLVGIDKAIEEPRRMGLYVLTRLGLAPDSKRFPFLDSFAKRELTTLLQLIKNKDYALSSSAGRLFDCAASLLGLQQKITYEAEAAILLEMLAMRYNGKVTPYEFAIEDKNNCYTINWEPLFRDLVFDCMSKKNKAMIARRFHLTIAVIIKEIALLLRKKYALKTVVLSGGVFQNMLLLDYTVTLLEKQGFNVYYNQKLPFNDSAISVGQVVIASEIIKK